MTASCRKSLSTADITSDALPYLFEYREDKIFYLNIMCGSS